MKVASEEHIDKAISEIQVFFQKTGTALKLFKEVYKEGIENNYALLAAIADEQCVDFRMFLNLYSISWFRWKQGFWVKGGSP